ncbi:MAG: hypothetical protein K0R18_1286 [Bacillales bacterium]|jgi:hypothetical protein|nr:hypothetical protein [Bacillales bacterium]
MPGKMYDLFNKEALVPGKKTIFICIVDRVLSKDFYSVTFQYLFNTLKILHEDFNIVIIARNGGTKWTQNYIEHEEFGKYAYLCFDKEKKYGGLDAKAFNHSQRLEYMKETFEEIELDHPELFENLAGTITTHCIIPSLDNNYEIVSDDPKLLAKQQKSIEKYQKGISTNALISHCAFIHKPLGFPLEFSFYLMGKYKDSWHYGFSHESSSAWLHFIPEYNPLTNNVKLFWYTEDNMSIREMVGYVMCELQELYGKQKRDKEWYENVLKNKSREFIFGGIFLYEVDHRVNAWYNFFQNLNVDGIIRTQTTLKPAIDSKDSLLQIDQLKLPKKYQNRPEVNKFLTDILEHPLIADTLPYEQYNDQLQDYMFTLIIRCYYGKYNNLTFRIHNSLYNGTIPLIDADYDVHNLQIPKEFRDKLIVKDNKEIEDKIKYFKEHPEEYRELFFAMYDYYIKDEFFEKSYYNDVFKNNFFKEIY